MTATIEAVLGDITRQKVDAIVNAANNSLLGGGGVDGAIHAAGGPDILAACRELRRGPYRDGLPTGEAVATGAGNLSARWVIHTVGPVFSAADDRSGQLARAYESSLEGAAELGAHSVALPSISTGVYGYPLHLAAPIAAAAARAWAGRFQVIHFVLFSAPALEEFRAALAPVRPERG